MQHEESIPFDVAFDLKAVDISLTCGAYYENKDKPFLHATAFVVDRNGKVRLAVYSTGAHGRLTAREALKAASN